MSHVAEPTFTPNVVIENPALRKRLGIALYIVAVVTGVVSFVLTGIDLPVDIDFWSARILGAISIISGAFGLGVTTPNVPIKA